MRHRFLFIIAIGIAIVAILGRAGKIRGALAGFALGRNILAVTKHLHLGQVQEYTGPHIRHANVAATKMLGALGPQLERQAPHVDSLHLQTCNFPRQRPGGQPFTGDGFSFQSALGHRFLKSRQPILMAIQCGYLEFIQFALQSIDLLGKIQFLFLLPVGENFQERTFITPIRVGGIIKDGKHAVEFLLANGIILVIVALAAGHGGTHPDGHGGIYPVNDGHVAKFLIISAPLAVGLGVAMEGSSRELILGRVGQQIAGHLLDGELIKGKITVKGANHPVAIGPDGAGRIIGVSGTVGIARQIQPLPRPMLAVGRLGQQTINQFAVGIGSVVLHEQVHLGQGRWQTGQVQRHAPDKRMAIGLR